MILPVKIQWNVVTTADRYAVYVHPEGSAFSEFETVEPGCVIYVEERVNVAVYVASRQGQLETISPEVAHVYVCRW